MTATGWVVFLHVVGAAIWAGGHLVLLVGPLREALRHRNPEPLLHFERQYEKVGLPALALQLLTGLFLLWQYQAWPFGAGAGPYDRLGQLKLLGLGLTLLLAAHARLRLLPRLNPQTLPLLALHVLLVTCIALGLLYLGIASRYGGL